MVISIHALREEGDQHRSGTHKRRLEFLSTPSARRATRQGRQQGRRGAISIHALREEGDEEQREEMAKAVLFLSTPSARRATADQPALVNQHLFLSTPSARRATAAIRGLVDVPVISIHALREEGDAICALVALW